VKLGVPTLCRYDLLQRLLDSAEAGHVRPSGYVIVDNGGEARARLRLPGTVELIEPGRNLGVAASWNVLLEATGSEAIVISNDDVALGPDAFSKIQEAARQEPLVTAIDWSLFAQGSGPRTTRTRITHTGCACAGSLGRRSLSTRCTRGRQRSR
jgi:GT2 family glycosyltransferase